MTPSAAPLIRRATDDDCPAILQCLHLAFAPYLHQYTPEGFLDTVLTLETLRLRMREMTVFVAVKGRTIVGTIGCVAHGATGHLRGMAVQPDSQGSGVSVRLLEKALGELREAGCQLVTLDTTEPLRRAVRFYEKHGFQRSGRVTDFFGMPLFEYCKKL